MVIVPQILVDADACPVKDEIYKVAWRHEVAVKIVSNSRLRVPDHPLIERVVVSDGFDAADDWIVDHVAAGDIVVTADVPLAGRCVGKDAFVTGPTGRVFDRTNIGMATAMRDLGQHLRETGESKGYNASFTKADRSQFLQALEEAMQAIRRGR